MFVSSQHKSTPGLSGIKKKKGKKYKHLQECEATWREDRQQDRKMGVSKVQEISKIIGMKAIGIDYEGL